MIALTPMTQEDFDAYLDEALPEYAQAHIDADDCDPDTALERARADYVSLLPAGLRSENHHLFRIRREGDARPIGMIWYEVRDDGGRLSAFIWDFRIEEGERGKGYGTATLARVDEDLAALGVRYVALNVMGHNQRARALYEKHGFHVIGIAMRKVIVPRVHP